MLRDLLSSQWFQGGLIFFLLCVAGSLLYSWHVLRTTESDMERHDRFTQGLEKQNEPHPAETVNVPTATESPGLVNTPDENTDTQMPDTTEALPNEIENLDIADLFLPDDFVSEEVPAEDVPVSPYGFGPYPEVPADFFGIPIWQKGLSDIPVDIGKNVELIDRVLIKLWQQRDKNIIGGFLQNGKVYPNYPETVYVRERIEESDDGLVTTNFSHITGPPGTNIYHEEIRRGNTPPHVTVIPMDDSQGFDPYSFLNLGEFTQ